MEGIELKCIPFIKTFGSDNYKKFITSPFDEQFLANTTNKDIIFFLGWQVKDRGNYKVYTNVNNNKYMFEIYPIGYNIITSAGKWHIPVHPQNIDQFITDCDRCELELFWDKKILNILTYNEILDPKVIKKYHENLLEKLGKNDI